MRGEVQRGLLGIVTAERKRERSTGRKLFPDCRTRLSRRLDFPKIPILTWTEEKCPEIFNALKPAENFIYICSLRFQPRDSSGFIAAIILPRHWMDHSRASRMYFSKFHLRRPSEEYKPATRRFLARFKRTLHLIITPTICQLFASEHFPFLPPINFCSSQITSADCARLTLHVASRNRIFKLFAVF